MTQNSFHNNKKSLLWLEKTYQDISTNFKLPTHGMTMECTSQLIPCNIAGSKVNGQEVAGCFFISLSLSCTLRRILSPFIQDFCAHEQERKPSILDILVLVTHGRHIYLANLFWNFGTIFDFRPKISFILESLYSTF